MYSGICLQQSRLADRFEPECAIFLHVEDAVVQWSKQTSESMRHIGYVENFGWCQWQQVALGSVYLELTLTSPLLCLPLQRLPIACREEEKVVKEGREILTICKISAVDECLSAGHRYCVIYWNKCCFCYEKKYRAKKMWNISRELLAAEEKGVTQSEWHQKIVVEFLHFVFSALALHFS